MPKKRVPAALLTKIAAEKRRAFQNKGDQSELGGYNEVLEAEERALDASLREFRTRVPAVLRQVEVSTGKVTTFKLSKRDRAIRKRQDRARGRRKR